MTLYHGRGQSLAAPYVAATRARIALARSWRSGVLAAGLGLAALAPAQAQAQSDACDEAVTQSAMNQCAQEAWAAEDERLNEAYQAAMAVLRQWDADLSPEAAGGAAKLREAQRAWLTFRDAGCAAEGFAMRGGSAEPLLVYGCLERVTGERADALESLAEYADM